MKAFGDTWRWDQAAARSYREVVEDGHPQVSRTLSAFHAMFGGTDMLAYLSMMAPRLIELRRVLKPTGTIYLHCDPTASHYLKILMDAVFGPGCFRNEIAWCYRGGGVPRKDFARKHDIILRYTKTEGDDYTFNLDRVRVSYSDDVLKSSESRYDKSYRATKVYEGYRPNPLGKHPEDWWPIQPIMPSADERLGYPTQKPKPLLARIIEASSNEGEVVLDPFCGCGTTIKVAQSLKRRWIGIDITSMATSLIKTRLADAFGDQVKETYKVVGEPVTEDEARELAQTDEYQFQWWALGLVRARPAADQQKKGADKGVDGRRLFHDDVESAKSKQIIFSVKAGQNIGPKEVRELAGTVTAQNAEMGALITMKESTPAMRMAAADAGFYKSPWGTQHPRIQIFTVKQLLDGASLDMPRSQDDRTFKKAPKAKVYERPDYLALPLKESFDDREESDGNGKGCGETEDVIW